MGDLVEFTTWRNQFYECYKITSSNLAFDVKTYGGAVIILLYDRSESDGIKVILDHDRYAIQQGTGEKVILSTLTSDNEFRSFWISWYNGWVRFGSGDEVKPLISYNIGNAILSQFLKFGTLHTRDTPVHWKFVVSPLVNTPRLCPVSGGELHWVRSERGAPLPDGAFIAGHENENLYIMRSEHQGSLTPGKYVRSKGLGYLGWSWQAHEKTTFEILCGFDAVWVPTSNNCIPPGAFVGGYSQNQEREVLYVGRAKYEGHLIPGKVQCSHNCCFIAHEAHEIAMPYYEILVVPQFGHQATRLLRTRAGVMEFHE